MWTDLPYVRGHRLCTTELCQREAVYHLEVGGVGSNYCARCRDKIEAQIIPENRALAYREGYKE